MRKIAVGVLAIASVVVAGIALAVFAVASEEREEPNFNLDFED